MLFWMFWCSLSHWRLGGGDQLCSYFEHGEAEARQFPHSLKVTQLVGGFKACPLHWQQVHELTEESAINGHIVCVLSRTMTLGTHSFVCLLAVAQPPSVPLNVKDTMGSRSLSIHIFGIVSKVNVPLSSRENKDPWISCCILALVSSTIKWGWTSLVNLQRTKIIRCSNSGLLDSREESYPTADQGNKKDGEALQHGSLLSYPQVYTQRNQSVLVASHIQTYCSTIHGNGQVCWVDFVGFTQDRSIWEKGPSTDRLPSH